MALVKLNNRGVRSATTFGSISVLGEMRFIKKQTASSSSTISFVHGTSDVVLDGTYKEYLFTFKNIHPSDDGAVFEVNFSTDGGSNYNVTKTSTYFEARHDESGSSALAYETVEDLAQSTDFQTIQRNQSNDNDHSTNGTLTLFNPSSTTFVKHFISHVSGNHESDWNLNVFVAGYANTTSAINAVQFKKASGDGDIDAGDICLYGIN